MAKRGRQSRGDQEAPELHAVAGVSVIPKRPEPPRDFDDVAAARWREIVDALDVDYFRPSDLQLLADMIRTEQLVQLCDELILQEGQVVEGSTGPKVHPAVTARKGHLATIASIQRALRLCPSTRTRPDAGKLKTKRRKRPWDV